jgi:hypothetical protein
MRMTVHIESKQSGPVRLPEASLYPIEIVV